jgi:hypothetical protein
VKASAAVDEEEAKELNDTRGLSHARAEGRAEERKRAAETVLGWLPRRQEFDSSFKEAMIGLAEKIEGGKP